MDASLRDSKYLPPREPKNRRVRMHFVPRQPRQRRGLFSLILGKKGADMNPRFAFPALIFATGLVGLTPPVHAERAADIPRATPNQTATTSADNPAGFLGVAVAESMAPPDAGPEVPRTVLLISDVRPDSPADQAGLRSGDILLKIDGQHLLHPVQLQRLVSTYPAGQAVELTVIRDGDTQTLPATLGERPAAFANPQNDDPGLGPAPAPLPEDFDWLAPQPMPRQLDLQEMQQRMDRQFEQMRQMFRQGMNDGWPGGEMWERGDPIDLDLHFDLDAVPRGQQITVLQDNDHKITLTQTADGRHLLAADAHGNVLFDGPINTPAQLDAVPQAVRQKLPQAGEPGRMNFEWFRPFDPNELFDRITPRPPLPPDHDGPGEQLPAPAGRAV